LLAGHDVAQPLGLGPACLELPHTVRSVVAGMQGGCAARPANTVVATSRGGRRSFWLCHHRRKARIGTRGIRPIGLLGALRGCARVGHHSPGIRHSPIMRSVGGTNGKPDSATGIPWVGFDRAGLPFPLLPIQVPYPSCLRVGTFDREVCLPRRSSARLRARPCERAQGL
jgi:hypothetical protein